jgi:hypothetical protein
MSHGVDDVNLKIASVDRFCVDDGRNISKLGRSFPKYDRNRRPTDPGISTIRQPNQFKSWSGYP